jgi:hypothetical protein
MSLLSEVTIAFFVFYLANHVTVLIYHTSSPTYCSNIHISILLFELLILLYILHDLQKRTISIHITIYM